MYVYVFNKMVCTFKGQFTRDEEGEIIGANGKMVYLYNEIHEGIFLLENGELCLKTGKITYDNSAMCEGEFINIPINKRNRIHLNKGKYTYKNGLTDEGEFALIGDTQRLIHGKRTGYDGTIEEGKFDIVNNFNVLLCGKVINANKTVISGEFKCSDSNVEIHGTYVDLEKTLYTGDFIIDKKTRILTFVKGKKKYADEFTLSREGYPIIRIGLEYESGSIEQPAIVLDHIYDQIQAI